MSGENIALVRNLLEEWNRGETSRLADRFHRDAEFLPLRAATEGAYRGPAGIESFVADTREVFDKFEMRFEFADLGERVLAWGTIHVRARGSGIETDVESGGMFEFRDGKVVRWEDFGSKSKALDAAELDSRTRTTTMLRRCYKGLNDGDLQALEDLLAPGFVYHTRPELPGGGTYRGREICMDRFRELGELFTPLHWKWDDFVEVGGRIMVIARLTGAGRASGVEIEESIVHVWTLAEGHAVELHVFSDRGEALRAMGLPAED